MHEKYMKEAIELAKKGMGFVNPNPMVGAVIVKNGEIIGRGFHKKYGCLHAEREVFADCDSRGINCTNADMYVTLEPCCHHGKTPPCTDAVIQHKIGHVYIGSSDPNPLVAGKGVKILREHGIEVTEGILKDECDELNEIFFHYITTGRPFVTMKYAMTMDGKIACYTGESKWITGEQSRMNVQYERLRHSAIMVGIGTVLADNPMLTCRLENGRNPIRIICDSRLRIPLESNIVQTAKDIPTIIATTDYGKRKNDDKKEKRKKLEDMGCSFITTSTNSPNSRTDLKKVIKKLGDMKIDSILLEGGGELNWSMLNVGLVNKVQAYIAPKIFGGAGAKSAVSGRGVPVPSDAFMLTDTKVKHIGDDILIESRVKNVHGDN
ncbi:MAG: bifunctional diaminohydroxyphosphoribosylaminopyrimidine deaminase/5-amino-6-(5-phosphoribosylamino)uracil reductase RibD [Ruminococcus sp.]|nr:bifunctional diaminohydroxyphosphoribosylaminopyrimidine deaminase/5-amino-6-(5-phosphoribosylamino)uracil reductase RibD [Ruminococcus sp.]